MSNCNLSVTRLDLDITTGARPARPLTPPMKILYYRVDVASSGFFLPMTSQSDLLIKLRGSTGIFTLIDRLTQRFKEHRRNLYWL